jgi:hypothetical protein
MMLISGRETEGATREVLELVDVNAGREPVQSGAAKGIAALMHIKK